MKTLINQARFLKALEYTSEHYFSKPYTISPMVDRWFNQLAMIQLEGKSRPMQLSMGSAKELATFPVDVVIDGEVLAKEKVALIFKFHSQKSEHEKERKNLITQNEELEKRWAALNTKKQELESVLSKNPADEEAKAALKAHEDLIAAYNTDRDKIQTIEAFDRDKTEAKTLYDGIVAKIREDDQALRADPTYEPKVKSVINIAAIEAQYKTKVLNIVHRPNHGFAHSARAAYSVTAIQSYRKEHQQALSLDDSDLEKLQLMMLFSVVGRKDETGFSDSDPVGGAAYKSFRTGSGRAYLNYCLSKEGQAIYQGKIDAAYRDAIVVELMGYDDINNAIRRYPKPQLLLDYVIMKEAQKGKAIPREEALKLIEQNHYSLGKLFDSTVKDKANHMLVMMNDAHGLDLTRCYSLFPTTNQGSDSVGVLSYHLSQSKFLNFKENPNPEQLESFYQFMRTSFDTLQLTGQNSMFGLLSHEEFAKQKANILSEVKDIYDYCQNPDNRETILLRAMKDHKANDTESYYDAGKAINDDDALLKSYQKYLITRAVSEKLAGIVEYNLGKTQLLQFKDAPSPEKLDEFHRLLSLSYNTLPGKPILNASEFAAKKADILKEMKRVADDFKDPDRFTDLVREAKLALADTNNPFRSDAKSDKNLLTDYRNFQVANATYQGLTGKPLNESLQTRLYSDNAMFKFQHQRGTSLSEFDHHKNAVSMVQGFQQISPYKGLEQPALPKISAVEHRREQGKTIVSFEDSNNATFFQESYKALFGITPSMVENKGVFSIEVDRAHYKQMLAEQLIEFKQVTIQKKVEREEHLIDENGTVDAINLIAHSQGLVRLVSTTALNGEDFPDYDYLLRSFEDPVHQRYTPALKEMEHFPLDHGRYYDPRSGKAYERTVVDTPAADLRFQEPITTPPSLADKQAEGWTVSSAGRGAAKNTIYTKKMAHTLMPAHGKVMPFAGYTQTQHLYFPIGVLSDVKQVDLKDERYIWAQNMVTAHKFWIRDPSVFRKGIHVLLNAQLNNDVLVRHPNGVAQLNKEKIPQLADKTKLVQYLETKATKFAAKLDEKYYRPSNEDLNDFKKLIAQQRQACLKQVQDDPNSKDLSNQINAVFSKMNERIDLESQRKGLKYSMTLRELIQHQEKNKDVGAHNELLAANTKGATRAFYATKDTLLDRLNVAFHGMKIKEKYGYDVPLLVMSQDKAPYNYSEAMIRRDLKEAAHMLRAGTFPFDKTLFKIYEYDAKGMPVVVAGERVVKKDDLGRDIEIPKNLQMQQDLLLDFFKVGLPELRQLSELADPKTTDDSEIDTAIDRIIEQMNFIGGLERETALMERTLASKDQRAIEQFFLRSCSLGHESLVEQMLTHEEFKIPNQVLEKGSAFAANNNHHVLQEMVDVKLGIVPFKRQLAFLEKSVLQKEDNCDPLVREQRIKAYIELIKKLDTLPENANVPELKSRLEALGPVVLSNTRTKFSLTNLLTPPEAFPLIINCLAGNEEAIKLYAKSLAEDTVLPLAHLANAHEKLDSVNKTLVKDVFINILHLNASHGPRTALNYLSIQAIDSTEGARYLKVHNDSAARFASLLKPGVVYEDVKAQQHHLEHFVLHEGQSVDQLKAALAKEAIELGTAKFQETQQILASLQSIAKQNPNDLKLKQYCDAMIQQLEASQYDYSALVQTQKQLLHIHEAVTSPEVFAINRAINRLEHRANNDWIGIGNQKKADKIKTALYEVELADRLHVFSNPEGLTSCKKVKEELSSHRLLANPFKYDKTPTSAKEVSKEIDAFKRLKQQHAELTKKPDDSEEATTSPSA